MTLKQLNELSRLPGVIRTFEREISDDYAVDTVSGSSKEYPYIKRTVTIRGYTTEESAAKAAELTQLKHEYKKLTDYIDSIENKQLQVIFILRFIKSLSWRRIAFKIGGNNTEESVKKMVYRYIRQSDNKRRQESK